MNTDILETRFSKHLPDYGKADNISKFLCTTYPSTVTNDDQEVSTIPLNESYAGKRPQLLEIEKDIGRLREAIGKPNAKINDIKSMCDMIGSKFAKIFNFKKVFLMILPTKIENAAAVPQLSYMNPLSSRIRIGKNGIWDESGSIVAMVYVTKGLLLSLNILDSEIVGALLHEFGHSLDVSRITMLQNLYIGGDDIELAKEMLGSDTSEYLFKLIEKHPEKKGVDLSKRASSDSKISVDSEYGKSDKSTTLAPNGKSTTFGKVLAFPVSWLLGIFRGIHIWNPVRHGERVADSTAALYGYGYETAAFLAKLSDHREIEKWKNRKTNFIVSFFVQIGTVIQKMVDDHDNTWVRINQMIDKLKNDVQTTDYPKEAKSALLDDIKKLEELLRCKPNDPRYLVRLYTAITLFWYRHFRSSHVGV